MANKNLTAAKTAKNDEFYTRLEDIEKECFHYKDHFRGKTVYCNCDDPCTSNFVKYFLLNFDFFGLKKLIASGYNKNGRGSFFVYNGEDDCSKFSDNGLIKPKQLKGNGDFRSQECLELLQESDIVVTNPPFSLLKEYFTTLFENNKAFLIIGNLNAITYKEVFQQIKNDKVWLGVSSFNNGMYFKVPDNCVYMDSYKFLREIRGEKVMRVAAICWFTTLTHNKRNKPLELYEWYEKNPNKYPQYENYKAIEVTNTNSIPSDYEGVMGVPITFLNKYCPGQFKVIGLTATWEDSDEVNMIRTDLKNRNRGIINGKTMYARVLIKHKNPISYKDHFKQTKENNL